MHREPLLQLLNHYHPTDDGEAAMLRQLVEFVRQNPACFERTLQTGHVTGSAWVVNEERTRALLVHHAKLNRWLQPGGHADGESDILNVALREAREETGLLDIRAISLCGESPEVFDIDVHPIPAHGAEPGHLHYDVRFLLEASDAAQPQASSESHDVRWFDLDEIERSNPGPSITRMVDKTRLLCQERTR